MAPRRRDPTSDVHPIATSWMSLLASTSLGLDGSSLCVVVHADASAGLEPDARYRLVLQTYDRSIRHGARPIGSTQRVVTGRELQRGVELRLIELRAVSAGPRDESGRGLVVAWIERGSVDLELDARAARPQPGQVYGTARRPAGARAVRIALRRTVRLAA